MAFAILPSDEVTLDMRKYFKLMVSLEQADGTKGEDLHKTVPVKTYPCTREELGLGENGGADAKFY